MSRLKTISALPLFFLFFQNAHAQNRIRESNTIGWYNTFLTIPIGKSFSLHNELQFRRTDWIQNGQQRLLRFGLNYQWRKEVLLRVGYAQVETFDYGTYPINSLGKKFPEHRIYQMMTISNKLSNLTISHRFMLEQRWLGKYSSATLSKPDSYVFFNRIRYMCRLQVPLVKKMSEQQSPYFVFTDEVMIGMGKNVGENVFDQNRLGLMIGVPLTKNLKIEIGYLNQVLQLGREVDQKNVFQYNSGLQANLYINLKKNN